LEIKPDNWFITPTGDIYTIIGPGSWENMIFCMKLTSKELCQMHKNTILSYKEKYELP
jgi:hypothetical protein